MTAGTPGRKEAEMGWPKLTCSLRVRLSEEIYRAVCVLAEIEDRTFMHEVRHLIRLGLEQKLEVLRTAKLPRNLALGRKRFLQLFGEDS